MSRIYLSKGRFAIVDSRLFAALSRWKWTLHTSGDGRFAAYRNAGTVNGKRKNLFMHRQILGASPGEMVDHINGNPLDNRIANLRICNPSENSCNQKLRRNNRSGFKGVRRHRKKWQAVIQKNKNVYCIGTFSTRESASQAYKSEAKKRHREFVREGCP